MKRQIATKVTAAITLAAMAMSAVGCGSTAETPAPATDSTATDAAATTDTSAATDTAATDTAATDTAADTAEDEGPYTIIKDADGNPIDLGGMEIIIRDWWSDPEGIAPEPTNDYEEAVADYRDWIQETYNFTIKQQGISDWGSTPEDFANYVTGGDQGENYIWVLRSDAIGSALGSGLLYDLSTLDCLDFSLPKFQNNKVAENYTVGGGTYAMYAGFSEPRTGVYFNKRVLTEAGIDPESIYDMQADGTWTWQAFDDLMAQVQRDTDNDGQIDVWGLTLNEGSMTSTAVASNGGAYIGTDANGFTYELENQKTLDALDWTVDMFTKYDQHDPEGANWDYYKEEFQSGTVAFMVEDAYEGYENGIVDQMDDECGYVMFPAPSEGVAYVNVWSNNPICIPACYDADKAWKLAFAWNLYTEAPAGYEDYNGQFATFRKGCFDERAVDETLTMMMESEHGVIQYHGLVPNLQIGPDFVWSVGPNADISALVEAIRDTWKQYIEDANAAFN